MGKNLPNTDIQDIVDELGDIFNTLTDNNNKSPLKNHKYSKDTEKIEKTTEMPTSIFKKDTTKTDKNIPDTEVDGILNDLDVIFKTMITKKNSTKTVNDKSYPKDTENKHKTIEISNNYLKDKKKIPKGIANIVFDLKDIYNTLESNIDTTTKKPIISKPNNKETKSTMKSAESSKPINHAKVIEINELENIFSSILSNISDTIDSKKSNKVHISTENIKNNENSIKNPTNTNSNENDSKDTKHNEISCSKNNTNNIKKNENNNDKDNDTKNVVRSNLTEDLMDNVSIIDDICDDVLIYFYHAN